ncbi:MAG: bifunctional phosphopantothenoylcysteine decarboxylase/phosphopantothenate--cysteine ligase CoaBC [Bacteroidota bacterium]
MKERIETIISTPSSLKGKKILLGVTGSIAAYKAAFLTRLFVKAGAEVKVLMTEAATKFISKLSLSTLSKNPVYTAVAGADGWNNHVELGLWADAMVVAPLTATTLSKMAHGICDNMIVAAYLSARCPVFFAPAMDVDMWLHPASQENVQRLQQFGNHLIPVGHGELASGLTGAGRMAEPEQIVSTLEKHFIKDLSLANHSILITAGPTFEPIDPVRFIGNRSSGKMGVAIALAAAKSGAKVHLILGPSKLTVDHPGVELLRVQTALEMYEASVAIFPKVDVAIMAAAVADYRPKAMAVQKIKKAGEEMKIDLVKNPDIAASLGSNKQDNQLLVGFALETNNALENAQHKLVKKNLDLIVLNSLQDPGAGFNHDTNKITIIDRDNKQSEFELKSKALVAVDILNAIQLKLQKKTKDE